MKKLIHLISGLAASIGLANAEITNNTMRGLQERAAEKGGVRVSYVLEEDVPIP
ncbi:MAG: hypothetical protein P8M65_13265 [Roseibacillus sp.]|nr:hypothetical protein [Roseibacillus sp.]